MSLARLKQIYAPPVPVDGWKSMGEFAQAVWRAGIGRELDERLISQDISTPMVRTKAAGHLTELVGSSGGFLLPRPYHLSVLETVVVDQIVRRYAQSFPMDSQTLDVWAMADDDHSGGVFGGFLLSRHVTEQAYAESTPEFRNVRFVANDISAMTSVPNILLEDSPIVMEGILRAVIENAIKYYEDELFLTGNGMSEPLGVLNSPALITVDKEALQAANTITWNNLKAMVLRFSTKGYGKGVWVASNTTQESLLVLPDVMVNYAGVSFGNGGQMFLMGRPVLFTDILPTLGKKGDIILGNFANYGIGDRGLVISMSRHARFTSNETVWAVTLRIDGQSALNKPYIPRQGGDSLSPFVAIEERS